MRVSRKESGSLWPRFGLRLPILLLGFPSNLPGCWSHVGQESNLRYVDLSKLSPEDPRDVPLRPAEASPCSPQHGNVAKNSTPSLATFSISSTVGRRNLLLCRPQRCDNDFAAPSPREENVLGGLQLQRRPSPSSSVPCHKVFRNWGTGILCF